MSTRRLSYRQAVICELGAAKRCRCRCKGTLHGAKRFGDVPAPIDFARLALDDPHRIVSAWEHRKQPPLPTLEDVRARRRRTAPDAGAAAAPAHGAGAK